MSQSCSAPTRNKPHRLRGVAALCALFLLSLGLYKVLGPGLELQKKAGMSREDRLRLVSESHPLPEGFSIETAKLPNGKEFDARAIGALRRMLKAGEADGMRFVVCSAYRSVETQKGLFERKIQQYADQGYGQMAAYNQAKQIVAVPGCSEHNLGLAADIVSEDHQVLDDAYAATPEAKWLKAHAAEYGFILRYPADKQDITGIIFEPWHYRYVGEEDAAIIMEQGLCLEEYLEQIEP